MHVDILNEAQQHLLPRLARALDGTDYYLVGGAALALQVGHRSSVDFDWFAPQVGEPERLLHLLRVAHLEYTVLSLRVETVYVLIDTVQVSFIGYAYPLLQPVVCWPEIGLHMAGLDDIACMKLSAISSRGARKDFIDLHALITLYGSLEEYVRRYQQKYRTHDIGHVVRSLVYFEDAEREPELQMVTPVTWQRVTADFEKWVKALSV